MSRQGTKRGGRSYHPWKVAASPNAAPSPRLLLPVLAEWHASPLRDAISLTTRVWHLIGDEDLPCKFTCAPWLVLMETGMLCSILQAIQTSSHFSLGSCHSCPVVAFCCHGWLVFSPTLPSFSLPLTQSGFREACQVRRSLSNLYGKVALLM